MIRLLFWLGVIVLVLMALRSKAAGAVRAGEQGRRDGAVPQRAAAESESMACCFHCGVYFPASEAVRADGHDYCGAAHVRLPPK